MAIEKSQDPHLTALRLYLGGGAVAQPVYWAAAKISMPEMYDPLAGRILISAMLVSILLTSRWPQVEERLAALCVAAAAVMQAYYLGLGHVLGLPFEALMGTVIITAVGVGISRRIQQGVLFTLFTIGITAVAFSGVAQPDVSHLTFQLVNSTIAFTIGVIVHYRTALEHNLIEARATLEQRVVERTAELETEVEERRRAEALARQASRAKSSFLANMSHELRTPLNAIIGYSEMLEEELDSDGLKQYSGDLQRVQSSATHLLGLIDDILDLARVESGNLDLALEVLPVEALVEDCLQVVRPPAAAKKVALEVRGDVTGALLADRKRTKQILLNLLSNAVKFTNEGHIAVEIDPQPKSIALTVVDTGCGIPSDALATLFDRFVQVDNSPTRVAGGTGLGLAIGRELARQMGGEVTVTSVEGTGSRFTVVLPRATV